MVNDGDALDLQHQFNRKAVIFFFKIYIFNNIFYFIFKKNIKISFKLMTSNVTSSQTIKKIKLIKVHKQKKIRSKSILLRKKNDLIKFKKNRPKKFLNKNKISQIKHEQYELTNLEKKQLERFFKISGIKKYSNMDNAMNSVRTDYLPYKNLQKCLNFFLRRVRLESKWILIQSMKMLKTH